MKKFLVIALLMCGMCAQALVIEGGVHYTVESARDEAFSKVQYTIPMIDHFEYLVDPGFSRGKDGKPKIRKFGRHVTFFSDGWYAIRVYKDGRFFSYYYDENGNLGEIGFNIGTEYPILNVKYDTDGKLCNVSYTVKQSETYVYDASKKYIGHWINNKFYDANGNVTITRKTY